MDPVVAHAQAGATPLGTRLAVAAVAGLLATFVTNVPVNLLSHGAIPPRLAAAAVTRTAVATVSARATAAVYYAGGALAGLAFELLVLGLDGLPALPGPVTAAEVVAAALVAAGAFAGVAGLLLPRVGGSLYEDGATRRTVVRQWAACAATYGVALLATVPVVYALLP